MRKNGRELVRFCLLTFFLPMCVTYFQWAPFWLDDTWKLLTKRIPFTPYVWIRRTVVFFPKSIWMYSSARRAPVLSVQASQYRSANVGLVPRYRPSPQHGGFTELVCVTELVVNAVSQVSAGEMVSYTEHYIVWGESATQDQIAILLQISGSSSLVEPQPCLITAPLHVPL
jgi:hypothetical protein